MTKYKLDTNYVYEQIKLSIINLVKTYNCCLTKNSESCFPPLLRHRDCSWIWPSNRAVEEILGPIGSNTLIYAFSYIYSFFRWLEVRTMMHGRLVNNLQNSYNTMRIHNLDFIEAFFRHASTLSFSIFSRLSFSSVSTLVFSSISL